MSKYRSITKNPLRAVISEVLPYEVPLPFNTNGLYSFLRYIRFRWIDGEKFKVDARRVGIGEEQQLRFIFDRVKLEKSGDSSDKWKMFTVNRGRNRFAVLNPFNFSVRRNNGKSRNLAIMHPQSMLEIAQFIDDHADTILYFCNQSRFSLRHPLRVARVAVRKDKIFEHSRETEDFDLAQHDLEYDNLRSFFAYGDFNNINRFYSSAQFRACERKYPFLLRADISKCFDSIYTHTISWVINGPKASKRNRASNPGNNFDKLFQNLNYGETSGIIIGPEASRVFAEIILQEIDVLVERELQEGHALIFGRDYEVKRYVDDYFIFASRQEDAERIVQVLAHHLAKYKLHLNDQKTELLHTPLQSAMSIAKHCISKDLKKLTQRDVELEGTDPTGQFFFSTRVAVLEYKSTLLTTGLEHGDLANFYLYSLIQETRETCKVFGSYFQRLTDLELSARQRVAVSTLAKYLIACIDVALFVYAGAPSASHSLKLTELTVLAITELRRWQLPLAEMASFQEKIRREIRAQLNTAREARSFGAHTLNLIDCLTFLDTTFSDDELNRLLKVRNTRPDELDSLAVLTLIRACGGHEGPESSFLEALLCRSREIIRLGGEDPEFETERSILLLSLPHNPLLSTVQLEKATGLSQAEVEAIKQGRSASLFAWDANDAYGERLALKSSGLVY